MAGSVSPPRRTTRNCGCSARRTATREVGRGGGAADPAPSPTSAEPEPTDEVLEPTGEPRRADRRRRGAAAGRGVAGRPVADSGGFGLVQAAFLLGGLLLFLGAGLLLRLRQLTRTASDGVEGDARPGPSTGPFGPPSDGDRGPPGPGGARRPAPAASLSEHLELRDAHLAANGLAVAQSVAAAGSLSCSPA